jgi:uncharacterized protein YdaU (DUF1376 family)
MSEEQKRKAPAFQFYADDFLAGTSDMSAEEVGGYIRLLCHQWTKGGIPNDPDRAGRMATLLGSPSLGYVLAKFSLCNDGMLRNERLEQVRAEQEAYKLRQASSGRNGAEKRWSKWQKDGDPNGDPNGVAIATPMATPMAKRLPEDSSPSPSPTPNNKEESIAPKSQRSRFVVPSVEEVETACVEIGLPASEAGRFIDHYESKGWKVSGSPMKSWIASLRNWKRNRDERQQSLPIQPAQKKDVDWRDSI